MKEEMRKDIENWLDANVWDGDKVSNCPPSIVNNYRSRFNPHEICQLSIELVEHLLGKVYDNQPEALTYTGNMGHPPEEELPEDKGKHYRFVFKGIKFDPYRIAKMYGVKGGPQEHMLKKLLRGQGKGHTEEDLLKELQCCLDRWKEMYEEDLEQDS